MASILNTSKRTIDYYTCIGLLKAERSASNYRLYDSSAIEQFKFIHQCKQNHMPLDQIRELLEQKQNVNVEELKNKLSEVEQDIKHLINQLESEDKNQLNQAKRLVSHESISLMQTLLLLML